MSQWSSSVMVDEDVLGVVLLICCCLIFLVFELLCVYFFFFFQAEDGIRDGTVTGVQTCALPISERSGALHGYAETEVFAPCVVKARQTIEQGGVGRVLWVRSRESHSGPHSPHFWDVDKTGGGAMKIGRASCRERV